MCFINYDQAVERQGFLLFPFLPSHAQGCALREQKRVCWRGHASTPSFSRDPLAGREPIGQTTHCGKSKSPG